MLGGTHAAIRVTITHGLDHFSAPIALSVSDLQVCGDPPSAGSPAQCFASANHLQNWRGDGPHSHATNRGAAQRQNARPEIPARETHTAHIGEAIEASPRLARRGESQISQGALAIFARRRRQPAGKHVRPDTPAQRHQRAKPPGPPQSINHAWLRPNQSGGASNFCAAETAAAARRQNNRPDTPACATPKSRDGQVACMHGKSLKKRPHAPAARGDVPRKPMF
jgi:hypothetical protein